MSGKGIICRLMRMFLPLAGMFGFSWLRHHPLGGAKGGFVRKTTLRDLRRARRR